MLCFDFIDYSLGTQGVKAEKTVFEDGKIKIWLEMPRKSQKCPCCGEETEKIHDYRNQTIKAGELNGYLAEIVYRKRRYRCTECGKRFYEDNSFVGRYKRMTKLMVMRLTTMVKGTKSFTEVGKELGISTQTVIRYFNLRGFSKLGKLPEVLGIDEFRGNTGGEKYHVSITDPKNRKMLDVVHKRSESFLSQYFRSFPKEERDKVKYFVSDMYKPYARLAESWFPKAEFIVDRFHWIRQLFWAFENVRKRIQNTFGKDHRRYFKHSRKLLMKRFDELKDDSKQQVLILLGLSPDLSSAHFYKEKLQAILDMSDSKEQKKAFIKMCDGMKQSGIPELEKCADTYYNWLKGILASFDYPYSNGFTEGNHNKIKVLKRNGYGYKNFERFRKRILNMS